MPSAWREENEGIDCSGVGTGIVNSRLNMVGEWNVCFLVRAVFLNNSDSLIRNLNLVLAA